ncbi:MAG: ABC transporter ATP-binding protein/permease [Lachnospiraceae bacterium]|nr:ABC transporter ATP-binding protein/permease [Lachnospiraceae bacterium]
MKVAAIPVTLFTAWLLSQVVSQATSGDVEAVLRNSLYILVLTFFFIILRTGGTIWIRRNQSEALNRNRIEFLRRFFENPLDRLYQADYGELMENLNNDMDTASGCYTESLPCIGASILGILGCMAFLLSKSVIVALTLPGIALFQLIPPLIVRKYMQINYDECREVEAKITNHVVEAVEGFDELKLLGAKQWWQDRMFEYHKEYLCVGRKTDMTAAAQRSMYKFLDNILTFGTYALIGTYVIYGFCSLETAVQAIYLSGSFFSFVKALFSTIPDIAVAQRAERRIKKWTDRTEPFSGEPAAGECAIEHKKDQNSEKNVSDIINRLTGEIIVDDLHYAYKGNEGINGINMRFSPEQNYIIKGNNGAGKTTFLNLLAGILRPDRGELRYDRAESDYAGFLFYIPQQDPEYSFDAWTLFGMFDEEYRKVINDTARRLGLKEKNLNGCAIRDLSGGERKKVFLAIGFALRTQWLLLDEPTNNLDRYGKEVICELVRERKGVIIISHDTIFEEAAGTVLKMENGYMR